MGIKIITMAFFIGASVNAAYAAWEKVPLPPRAQQTPFAFMEFANPNLGYASIQERIWPENFLIYRDGGWELTRLGMFQGYAQDISLLPGGYGWLGGRHGGLYRLFYAARNKGGVGWDEIQNPYSEPPGYEGDFGVVSFGAVEDGWFLFGNPIRFLRYRQGTWEIIPNPLPAQLGQPSDICFVSANEGWVSGANGYAHYKNGTWEFVAGPIGTRLDFTAPDDGWTANYDKGHIIHYDGSSWRVVFSVPGANPCGLSFYDRNNGWAVFYKAGTPGLFYKYESGKWREIKPPSTRVHLPFDVVSPTEAWFLGSELEIGKGYKYFTWHWYTEPNVQPMSLGKIKTLFR